MSLDVYSEIDSHVEISSFQITHNNKPLFGSEQYVLPSKEAEIVVDSQQERISLRNEKREQTIDLRTSRGSGRIFPDTTDFHFYKNSLLFVTQYSSNPAWDGFDDFDVYKINLQSMKTSHRTYRLDFESPGYFIKKIGMLYAKGFVSGAAGNKLAVGFNEVRLDKSAEFQYIKIINLDNMKQYANKISAGESNIQSIKGILSYKDRLYALMLEKDNNYALFEINQFTLERKHVIKIPQELYSLFDKKLKDDDLIKILLEKTEQKFAIENDTLYSFFNLESKVDESKIALLKHNLITGETSLKKSIREIHIRKTVHKSIDEFFEDDAYIKRLLN